MTSVTFERSVGREIPNLWWLFLFTGGLWLLLAVIVFRFDWSTVSAISILFGVAMLGAVVVELLAVVAVDGWWKVAHGALATAFAVVAILSFVHPGKTFSALAAVMSFYFIIRGGFDVVVALFNRAEDDVWWIGLIVGVAELLIGFWAAGYFGRSVILLVAWVGVTALLRALTDFLLAFQLRKSRQPAL